MNNAGFDIEPSRGQRGAGRASSAPLMSDGTEPTIFELSSPGRRCATFRTTEIPDVPIEELIPTEHLRSSPLEIAEVSERDLVAHFTRLTHRQYSVDLGAYPLGSCTMKYNPKVCDTIAAMPGFAGVHPSSPPSLIQGWLEVMVELEEALCEVTGMAAATLQPAAGASGELTGLLLMRAWHDSQGSTRTRVIIPDSAHGTNPASVTLGGYQVTTVATDDRGCVDVRALKQCLGDDVAGIMLTNPNTLGIFEEEIVEISRLVHGVGGLLYYDGANFNAIMGVVRPGDMGFDIVHLNLHKTFATPHGGGGPGAGPVGVSQRLVPFLPGPRPIRKHLGSDDLDADGQPFSLSGISRISKNPSRRFYFDWETPPNSIGRIHSWHGNALVLARALAYIRLNGSDGLKQISQVAVLNSNWLRHRLRGHYDIPFDRPCMHELVVSANNLKKSSG
ncbi:MAG TPA: aminomethyl-transferring glycine dehydrogenase subunit GcvPB, partial [Acidimicrobiales bacterium]|nr:aminomethyl-transferring glycine dehydrogenase subunit GcvPB [Acidimicrobiales bacterium]